ncbi:MAG: hypothetical protein ACWA40_08055 [Planktomarina sp.]
MTDPDFPNEAAAQAFAKARAEIARVKRTGGDTLWLDGGSGFADLTHVPEEIVELAWLQRLSLNHTQITMAGLQAMARQDGFLQDADGYYGELYLYGTPALEDDGLRAVYEADYGNDLFNSKRTKAVLDYARNWKPPVPEDAPFAPRYHMDPGGPITSDPINPSDAADEIAALKDICLQKATRLVDTLDGNNEYAWVKTAAENYVMQMQKPFTKLALQLLFSHANTLLKAYQQHLDAVESGRRNEELPAALVSALSDIVETHGLLWANIPEAADIQAAVADYIQGPRREQAATLAAEIVKALEDKPDVLAPADHAAMVDDMEAAKGRTSAAAAGEAGLVGRVWNALGAFGRGVHKAFNVTGTLARDSIAIGAVATWAIANKTAIIEFVKAFSPQAAHWVEWIFRLLGA